MHVYLIVSIQSAPYMGTVKQRLQLKCSYDSKRVGETGWNRKINLWMCGLMSPYHAPHPTQPKHFLASNRCSFQKPNDAQRLSLRKAMQTTSYILSQWAQCACRDHLFWKPVCGNWQRGTGHWNVHLTSACKALFSVRLPRAAKMRSSD